MIAGHARFDTGMYGDQRLPASGALPALTGVKTMTTKQHLQSLGLTSQTVDAMQALRNGYSALHAAKHLDDLRAKRSARRLLDSAKRQAREVADSWN